VFFIDINADLGKKEERELQQKYGAENVEFMQCDITNPDLLKG
jgi:hypothetical protein